jgi:uncharacterized protein YcbK (DUF882 family)
MFGRHSRRQFLIQATVSVVALLPARRLLAASTAGALDRERCLSFVHTHTGERLTVPYFRNGGYVPAALSQLNELLRDFRTEQVHPIDPQLFDRLHGLQQLAACNEPFEIISGYRSPTTNAGLRQHSTGVAEHSLHMQGKAIDIRLPGCRTAHLAALARQQLAGGVGFYRVSDFVHVDTGRVRIWGDLLV